jgi:hypothetical protein
MDDSNKITGMLPRTISEDIKSDINVSRNKDGEEIISVDHNEEEVVKKMLDKLSVEDRQKLYTNFLASQKVQKNLTKNNYNETKNKFCKLFTLRHKTTGKIIEVQAASSVHACSLVGWNPKKVILISERNKS